MNRLDDTFDRKGAPLLNLYIPAGYPYLEATVDAVIAMEEAGADIVEIGMPYSDPLADGPTIQRSSAQALAAGMNLDVLFQQLAPLREHTQIPVILMGYFNQMVQYGPEKFLQACAEVGIDGLILPDLPLDYYEQNYERAFARMDLRISFLVTPETSTERMQHAARLSTGFLYVVSSASITGTDQEVNDAQNEYFKTINKELKNTKKLIGFGIHDKASFLNASDYADGAIIGSALIRAIEGANNINLASKIHEFVKSIKS